MGVASSKTEERIAMRRSQAAGAVVFFLFAAASSSGQETSQRLTFDVAAIHRSEPGATGGGIMPLPNGTGYMAKGMTAKTMMSVMYRIPSQQIVGGPGWFNEERFDVEARADHSYGIDDLHTMFKNLLADRFRLKFHVEMKEGPVYLLEVDKSGVKMRPDGAVGDLKVPINFNGRGDYTGTKVPMEYLCWFLGQQLQPDIRPVIDRTGLTQVYDFTFKFTPEPPLGASPSENAPPEIQDRPSLRDALQEQLGLKLEPAKGPVPNYVIDHIEMPSAN
jgi:uncharacterized protein (TIGR03435 family)